MGAKMSLNGSHDRRPATRTSNPIRPYIHPSILLLESGKVVVSVSARAEVLLKSWRQRNDNSSSSSSSVFWAEAHLRSCRCKYLLSPFAPGPNDYRRVSQLLFIFVRHFPCSIWRHLTL